MSFCPTEIHAEFLAAQKEILPCGGESQNSQLVFYMGDVKKLSGRPKLKQGNKVKKITARFSDDEFKLILGMEKEFGIGKTQLVRTRLLNDAGKAVINSRELLKHLDDVGVELGRSGNNINQLAKHANTLKLQHALSPQIVARFNRLMEAHIEIQRQLEISFRKIIRAMGK